MFVRRKVNKSGSTSVQVGDKSGGGYRVVYSLEAAIEEWEIQHLEARGRQYVKEHSPLELLLFGHGIDDRLEELVSGLGNSQVQVIGPEVIYGKHIWIFFMAYTIMLELESLLKASKSACAWMRNSRNCMTSSHYATNANYCPIAENGRILWFKYE